MSNNNNEPLMFINTVNKLNNIKTNDCKYQSLQNEESLDENLDEKISEYVLKYNAGYIMISEIHLISGEMLEGIIKKKTLNEATIKLKDEERVVNIKDIKSINIIEI